MTDAPPSWHPDPAEPARLRWWDGRTWTDHVELRVRPSEAPPGGPEQVLRAAAAGGFGHWRSWLAIGHLVLVPIAAAYLGMVGVNSWAYSYSFWNDSPPTDRADGAAVASLWALAVFTALVGVFGYGWLCRHALGGASLRQSLRASLGPSLRASWYAAPLLMVTAVCVLMVVPGIVAVALVGILPFLSLAPRQVPDGYGGLLARGAGPLALIGCVAVPIGLLCWGTFALTAALALIVEPLAWLVGWVSFCLGAVLLGATASAFAHLYREMAEAEPAAP